MTASMDPAQIESPTRSAAPPGEDVNLADPLLTCCRPVVAASIVGPTKPLHLAGAVDALDVHVTEDEIRALEEPYTVRALCPDPRGAVPAGHTAGGGSPPSRSMSTSLWRAAAPETIATCDGATPAYRATARTTAAFARPSAGGSRTHSSSVEPSHSRRSVRALGWTRTVTRVRPLTGCPPQRAAGCETSSTTAPR
jgi:hypothetical protein